MREPTTSPLFHPAPFDLRLPGAVDDLIAFHRATFGGFRMGPDDPPKDPPADPPKPPAPPADPPKPPADPPKDPVKLDITQDQLDKIIGERLADRDKKHQTELEQLKATAGKSDLEKAQLEKKAAEDRATTVTKESAQRIAKTEAKLAAIVAGGKTDRVNAIVAAADLTAAVDDDGAVDDTKVKTAIEKVLTDYPEWKAETKTTSTKSGSELGGGGGGDDKPSYTRKQIEDMTPAERVAQIDKINEAMAAGRITG